MILGCAMPEAEQGMNVARIASLRAGIPVDASAVTINRFCSSGLQSIAFAAERIMVGTADTIVAGGTESMSLVPMGGHKVAPNPELVAHLSGRVSQHGPGGREPRPGIVGQPRGAGRIRAAESSARPAAIAAGRFDAESVPVRVTLAEPANGNGNAPTVREMTVTTDEGPRADTSLDALGKLRPVFHAKGTVTAGNSSQTSDGAAAVVVTTAERAARAGLQPLARFVTYATAGSSPSSSARGLSRPFARRSSSPG